MRVLATAAFSFAAGIFLAQYLLPLPWQLPLCLCCVALGLAGFQWKGGTRRRILLICGAAALALAYNWAYVRMVQSPAEALAGTEQPMKMMLTDYAVPAEYGAKVTVRPETEGLFGVKVVYYGDAALLELAPGCVVTDRVELSSAARIRDDDITTFTSKGVFLLAYSRGDAEFSSGTEDSLRWLPQRCGRMLQTRITEMFPGDTAGFLKAILTGDKSGISGEAAVNLSEAGLYHVLAVSGMHCAYLLGLLTVFLGNRHRRLQTLVAIPVLLFYMLLTGCSPSVVRACIMMIFVLLAPVFRRERDLPTSMSTALMLILLQNPFAAASVSLQLSFAAIAGIIWATPAIRKLFPGANQKHRIAGALLYSVTTSLGVAVCTAPLSAWYFNILWLISPVSNLLCLWAAGIVFTFGLLAVLTGLVWTPLGMVLGWVAQAAIRYILWVAGLLTAVPYHALYFSNPYLKYWLLFSYGLFFLCWLLKPKALRKYAVAAGMCAVSLMVTVWLGTLHYTYGVLNITVLDVGQGAAMIVSSGDDFGLIDCGSRNSWYDAGQISADMLLSMGCGELDYLMLTHYDSDHISGVSALLSRISVKKILLPDTTDDSGLRLVVEELAAGHGIPLEYVTACSRYPLGEAVITVYPPVGKEGDNQRGLTYLCSAGEYDLLVTGDMNGATEKLLTETWQLPDIEALAVGHHGAASSTSRELLETVRPETALISVGSNSYGHPRNQVLRRLLISGAEIYRTDLQGNIHITVN